MNLNNTYLDCNIHSHRLEENKSDVSGQGWYFRQCHGKLRSGWMSVNAINYCDVRVGVYSHGRLKAISTGSLYPVDSTCGHKRRWTCTSTRSHPHGYSCRCLSGNSYRTRPHPPNDNNKHTHKHTHGTRPYLKRGFMFGG